METPRAQDLHSKSSSAYSPRARFSRSNLQQTRKPYAQISFMIAEMRSSSIMSGIAITTWSIAPILASLASTSSCGDGKRRSGATCASQIPSSLTGSQRYVSTRCQSAVLNEAHRHQAWNGGGESANMRYRRQRSLCLPSSSCVRTARLERVVLTA